VIEYDTALLHGTGRAGGGWGGSIAEKKISAYLLDRANGAPC